MLSLRIAGKPLKARVFLAWRFEARRSRRRDAGSRASLEVAVGTTYAQVEQILVESHAEDEYFPYVDADGVLLGVLHRDHLAEAVHARLARWHADRAATLSQLHAAGRAYGALDRLISASRPGQPPADGATDAATCDGSTATPPPRVTKTRSFRHVSINVEGAAERRSGGDGPPRMNRADSWPTPTPRARSTSGGILSRLMGGGGGRRRLTDEDGGVFGSPASNPSPFSAGLEVRACPPETHPSWGSRR